MKKLLLPIALVLTLLITGCKTYHKPEKVTPVENFKLTEYLGTWYEIARLEHKFEKGMEAISATYSIREDGGVKVLNKGYKTAEKEWSTAEGKAYFVGDSDKAFLKVSFFGPFYGSYIVMDTDYKTYTMISGPDLSYFWILSRTPTLEKQTLDRLVTKAKNAGFDTSVFIYPDQSMNNAK
ncbi:MAG: Outer membrane lipoprotein Blc [uncultured Sulfurovum sp.]|uniref:Outer membrane lipoprotein Blc n=1 Tax=uncultured Sulfurovum sp. TaxID=269237 RepID=A0A6S6U286_9BACT|nr:MAG: Outer membrane lipoprotein Blc [uncultured Sulfurovum sp.]